MFNAFKTSLLPTRRHSLNRFPALSLIQRTAGGIRDLNRDQLNMFSPKGVGGWELLTYNCSSPVPLSPEGINYTDSRCYKGMVIGFCLPGSVLKTYQ